MVPILLVTIGYLYLYSVSGTNYVSAAGARKMIKSGKINAIVDVRTNFEYDSGHYPGAIHLPVTSMNEKTTKKLPKTEILVYCNTGQRARVAAEKLVSLGFKNIYYISGLYSTLMPR